MQTVYKYPVTMEDRFTLELPQGATILTVQMQGGKPFLWALVDPDMPTEMRRFRLAGTGHPISVNTSKLAYIGTFQSSGGMLVFHLFELESLRIVNQN